MDKKLCFNKVAVKKKNNLGAEIPAIQVSREVIFIC